MPTTWAGVLPALMGAVGHDLRSGAAAGCWAVGAARGRPEVTVASRPWDVDDRRAIVEVADLLRGLGCGAVALAVTGRAWSLDDPVAPVAAGADLRQPVLVVHVVEVGEAGERARRQDLVVPFTLICDEVDWSPPVDLGPCEGWSADAALDAVQRGTGWEPGPEEVARLVRAARVAGHDVVHRTDGR